MSKFASKDEIEGVEVIEGDAAPQAPSAPGVAPKRKPGRPRKYPLPTVPDGSAGSGNATEVSSVAVAGDSGGIKQPESQAEKSSEKPTGKIPASGSQVSDSVDYDAEYLLRRRG